MTDQHRSLPQRILDWLRAGYPEGVPHTDHVALMGLLHRSLTETEVREVAEHLAEADDFSLTHEEIASAISEHVKEKASDADVDRVASRLVEAGIGMARDRASGAPSTAADRA